MPKHTENALTDRNILHAKSKDKQYKIFDGKGLFVLCPRLPPTDFLSSMYITEGNYPLSSTNPLCITIPTLREG